MVTAMTKRLKRETLNMRGALMVGAAALLSMPQRVELRPKTHRSVDAALRSDALAIGSDMRRAIEKEKKRVATEGS